MAFRVQPSRRAKTNAPPPVLLAPDSPELSPGSRPPIVAPAAMGDASPNTDKRAKLLLKLGTEEYNNRLTWAFYSFRNVIGYDDIRIIIIKSICENASRTAGLEDVKFATISGEEAPEILREVEKLIASCVSEHKRKLFITIAEPANIGESSHYIVLLFDLATKRLIVFDPAQMDPGEKVLYQAYFLKAFLKLWRGKGFRVSHFKTSIACQKSSDATNDFFCQTWSLYYIVWRALNYTVKHTERIPMPALQRDRFNILLGFIKECIRIPIVKKEITDDLVDVLNDHIKPKSSSNDLTSEDKKLYRHWIKDAKAGEFIKQLSAATVDDMINAEGERPKSPSPQKH